MKKILMALCFFVLAKTEAQTSFFVDKKGNKTIVSDDKLDILVIDKRVSYVLPGKTWNKYITFKDLDYVRTRSLLFKTFRLNGKKKDEPFFVYAENKQKKLLVRAIIYQRDYSSVTQYNIVVVDNKDTVLEELNFKDLSKFSEEWSKLAPLVRRHFAECPALMEILSQFDAADGQKEILQFLDHPTYINCQ